MIFSIVSGEYVFLRRSLFVLRGVFKKSPCCGLVHLTSSTHLLQPGLLCRAREGFGYAEVRMVQEVTLAKADFSMLRAQWGRISGWQQGTGLVITRE
jgi:hypothetical protein